MISSAIISSFLFSSPPSLYLSFQGVNKTMYAFRWVFLWGSGVITGSRVDFNPVNESVKKLVKRKGKKRRGGGWWIDYFCWNICSQTIVPFPLSIARKVPCFSSNLFGEILDRDLGYLFSGFFSKLSRLNWKNIGRNQWRIRCFDNFLILPRERNWNRTLCTLTKINRRYRSPKCQIETHSTEDEPEKTFSFCYIRLHVALEKFYQELSITNTNGTITLAKLATNSRNFRRINYPNY